MILPPLNPADAALLTRFLTAREDLHALLGAENPPDLIALLDFLARPDFAPWLDHYHHLHARALRNAAHDALARLIRESDDPIQRRLAAAAILNSLRPPRAPRSAGQSFKVEQAPRAPRARDPRLHQQPTHDSTPLPPADHRAPTQPAPTPSRPDLTASLHDALAALGLDASFLDDAEELEDAVLDGDLADLLEDDALDGALGEDLRHAALNGELDQALEDAIDRADNLPALAEAFRRASALSTDSTPGPDGQSQGPSG